jgi:hypothetical protein
MNLSARKLVAPAAVLVLAAGIGVASAGIPSSGGKIFGCYAKKGGALRVVSAGKKCKKSERARFWNQQGPQGSSSPQGASGSPGDNTPLAVKGPQGPAGPKGDKGSKGDTGAKGAKGDTGPKGDTGAKGAKGDTGPKGDTGAKGDKGLKGDKGDSGLGQVTTRSKSIVVLANNEESADVDCLPGEVALGGGFFTNEGVFVRDSEPTANGWEARFSNGNAGDTFVTAYVRCAKQ